MRILFIKPGDKTKNQKWDIHNFAEEVSSKNRFEVYFLTSNFSFTNESNITVFPTYPPLKKTPELIISYFKRIFNLAKTIKRISPHIVYVNNHIGAFSSLICIRLFGKKTEAILDIRTLPDKKWKYLYYRVITASFDWVFALNNEIIKKVVCNKSNSFLPLGYDPALFYAKNLRPVFRGEKTLNCVYYGSLDKKRKLLRLISGVLKAENTNCHIKLCIIGEGNDRDRLMKFVNETNSNQIVSFHGFMNQNRLREILLKSDLGISFVPDEGMYKPQIPLKAVEMLACGLPVLATDTEGNREIVQNGENGYISGDTSDDLSLHLQKIYKNGISESIYQNAAKSVKHLTWKTIVEIHLLPAFGKIQRRQAIYTGN